MPVLLVFAFGCAAARNGILSGTFRNRAGMGEIVIAGDRMQVKMEAVQTTDPDANKKSYQYTLLNNGRIQLTLNRSAELLYGVGLFDFYWDGRNITAVDRKGSRTDFEKSE